MKRTQWYYRGSLRSCNYQCSYCPFGKKRGSEQEYERDRMGFEYFVNRMSELLSGEYDDRFEKALNRHAVMLMPYGEALIHPYYWSGLAKLSNISAVEAVGAQTNAGFSTEKMIDEYLAQGGRLEKLRLWCSFHPQMTTVPHFLHTCEKLQERGIQFSVGAVGIKENLSVIQELREGLPKNIYLWINREDRGRQDRRCGDEKERKANCQRNRKGNFGQQNEEDFFLLDDYFYLEHKKIPADKEQCQGSFFVRENGDISGCCLSRAVFGNLYRQSLSELYAAPVKCSQTYCSCYQAYCHRNIGELIFFKPFPAFRIPQYPKAVFFDVDGTLLHESDVTGVQKYAVKKMSASTFAGLENWLRSLARHCELYLATSLTPEMAAAKLGGMSALFCGGVYASGGLVLIRGEEYCDRVHEVSASLRDMLAQCREKYHFKLRAYSSGGKFYKITLKFSGENYLFSFLTSEVWNVLAPDGEEKVAADDVKVRAGREVGDFCFIVEGCCLQIMAGKTGKIEGIREICAQKGYDAKDLAVFGNSENDLPMFREVPFSVAAAGSEKEVESAALYSRWEI